MATWVTNLQTILTVWVAVGIMAEYIKKSIVPHVLKRHDYQTTSLFTWFVWVQAAEIFSLITIITVTLARPNDMVAIAAWGVASFFLALMAQSDYNLKLVPREITTLFIMASAVVGAYAITTGAVGFEFSTELHEWMNMKGLWAGVLLIVGYATVLFLFSVFVPVVGFADIKTFWALGISVGFIVSPFEILVVYAFASLLALGHGALTKSKNVPLLPSLLAATMVGVALSA